jgi:hypothetical protein
MLNSSVIRLMKSRALVAAQQRCMSALLVPIQPREVLPYELRSFDLTEGELEELQVGFRAFNARCSDELKEMN